MEHRIAPGARASAGPSTAPERSGLVLVPLILAAAVANLNLSVANVALPTSARPAW
jgi:MFS transporter, DHA2 family, multidrug resistance protein